MPVRHLCADITKKKKICVLPKVCVFTHTFLKARPAREELWRVSAARKQCLGCACRLSHFLFPHLYRQEPSRSHARSSSFARSGRAPTTTSLSGITPSSASSSASSPYPSSESGSCHPAAVIAGCWCWLLFWASPARPSSPKPCRSRRPDPWPWWGLWTCCWRSSSSSYSLTACRPCGPSEGRCASLRAQAGWHFESGTQTPASPKKDTEHCGIPISSFFHSHLSLSSSVFYLFLHKSLWKRFKTEVLQLNPTKSGSVKNLWWVSNFLSVYIYACWYLGSTCVTLLCCIYFCISKREFKEGCWNYTLTRQTWKSSYFASRTRYAVFIKYCLGKVKHINSVLSSEYFP